MVIDGDQRRRTSARLLDELAACECTDADWLYALALGAGRHDEAVRYGLRAAEHSVETLAFEHAAALYKACLELQGGQGTGGADLRAKYAGALVCSGRGSEAADAYLDAAAHGVDRERVTEWEHLAASHLLRSGRFSEGEVLLKKVLRGLGLAPDSRSRMVWAIAWGRVSRGIGLSRYQEREISRVDPASIERLDALLRHGMDVAAMDPITAGYLIEYQTRAAFQVGDPTRALIALGGDVVIAALQGRGRAVLQHVEQARGLAERAGTPWARAYLCQMEAVGNLLLNQPGEAIGPARESVGLFGAANEELGYDTYYESQLGNVLCIAALVEVSDPPSFVAQLDGALRQARATQNRAGELYLALCETVADVVRGRADAAATRLEVQRTQLPPHGFGIFHAVHLAALYHVAPHVGGHAWITTAQADAWRRFSSSPVRSSRYLGAIVTRGRLNTQASDALRGDRSPDSLAQVLRQAERLDRRYPGQVAADVTHLLRARLASRMGREDEVLAELRAAVETAASAFISQRYRMALGAVLGGAEGRALYEGALRALRGAGVADPVEFAKGWCGAFL